MVQTNWRSQGSLRGANRKLTLTKRLPFNQKAVRPADEARNIGSPISPKRESLAHVFTRGGFLRLSNTKREACLRDPAVAPQQWMLPTC